MSTTMPSIESRLSASESVNCRIRQSHVQREWRIGTRRRNGPNQERFSRRLCGAGRQAHEPAQRVSSACASGGSPRKQK